MHASLHFRASVIGRRRDSISLTCFLRTQGTCVHLRVVYSYRLCSINGSKYTYVDGCGAQFLVFASCRPYISHELTFLDKCLGT